ncbi:MerR family transcriptional regulator [Tabrizicola oligotrophica]|uniref:MerR family transcriptional regulator n=1 Tax=Tabrizicola oligotrophica TaxID=2710650 RepID=A0A6M0QNW7_9RHOB|nr:MerR family transcriptional regulator [Tabrizicola oligotrophica]NEY89135.1 MerR family transcriptional regulator [Tabrizicola oligotrophica]
MDKSPDAFRTISEVAEVLETPAHVLRFWESRFPQIRPVKRAGGRRYYRPADVSLLLGIKHLLHDEGLTIRGVQKILREQGVRHVSGMSGQETRDEAETAEAALEAALAANFGRAPEADPVPQDQIETAQIVALEDALRARNAEAEKPDPVAEVPAAAPADVLPLFDHFAAEEAPEAALQPPPAQSAEEAVETLLTALETAAEPDPAPRAALPADAPLRDRLRALPAGRLASPEARALRDRLADLAARLASPPPPAPF